MTFDETLLLIWVVAMFTYVPLVIASMIIDIKTIKAISEYKKLRKNEK